MVNRKRQIIAVSCFALFASLALVFQNCGGMVAANSKDMSSSGFVSFSDMYVQRMDTNQVVTKPEVVTDVEYAMGIFRPLAAGSTIGIQSLGGTTADCLFSPARNQGGAYYTGRCFSPGVMNIRVTLHQNGAPDQVETFSFTVLQGTAPASKPVVTKAAKQDILPPVESAQ